MRHLLAPILVLALFTTPSLGQEKVTYQDHALAVFRNACLNCHNPDKKKGGLDLSTYSGVLAGGGSGKVIEPGDPDGSLLYRLVTHADEPTMPPKADKLPEKELDLLKRWIAGGVLENSGGTAVVSAKPKLDLTVSVSAKGKPDGEPTMPGDLLLEPPVHTARPGAVLAMASSPWAPLVAIGGQKQVLLYNPQTRELLGVLPFAEGFPNVLRFSRSGKLLLVAGGVGAKSGKAVLFDVATGNRVTEVGDELDSVLAADISPDQSIVALGGPAKIVKLYSTANGAMVAKIAKHTDWVTAIAFSPDGVLLATGDRNGGLVVWEAETQNEFYTLPGHKASVTSARFRPDSNVLATAGEDGDIKLWDMTSGKQAKSWTAHPGGVLSIDFAPDGRLVSAGRDKRARAWKPDGGAIKGGVDFNDIALHATFDNSKDAKLAVAADWTGEVRVFVVGEKGDATGNLDANPPPIAEQLAQLAPRLSERQAAVDQLGAELASAQERFARFEADKQDAQSALSEVQKSIDEAQSLADAAAKAQRQAAAAGAPETRALVEQAARDAADAATLLADARQLKAAAEGQLKAGARIDQVTANVEKIKSRLDEAEGELAAVKQQAARLQAGQFFTQVYAARQELLTRKTEAAAADAAASAAQATAEQAVADVPAFEKRIAEFPRRLAALEHAIPLAQQSATAAANIAAGLAAIAAEREAFVKESQSHASKIADLASKNADNKAFADAAVAAKTATDLLAGELKKLQEGVAARQKAAKEAEAVVAAAKAELEKEKLVQQNAPQTLASLRAAIPAAQASAVEKTALAQAAAAKLAEAKVKADQLDADYLALKKQLGLVVASAR
jgi:hypothetical protein